MLGMRRKFEQAATTEPSNVSVGVLQDIVNPRSSATSLRVQEPYDAPDAA